MIPHNVYTTTESGEFKSRKGATEWATYVHDQYPTFHVTIVPADDPGTVVREWRPVYM